MKNRRARFGHTKLPAPAGDVIRVIVIYLPAVEMVARL